MRKIDRFDNYMKFKKINDNIVTNQLNLSVGTIGKSRLPGRDLSAKVVEKILNFFQDLNKEYLIFGEGEMIKKETKIEENKKITLSYVIGEILAKMDIVQKQISVNQEHLTRNQDQIDVVQKQIDLLIDLINKKNV